MSRQSKRQAFYAMRRLRRQAIAGLNGLERDFAYYLWPRRTLGRVRVIPINLRPHAANRGDH